MPFFKKKGPSSTYTDDYGNINFISFLASVYSRLAYTNEHQFLLYYTRIFGPIIPLSIMEQINTQVKTNGIGSINKDKIMFNLSNELNPYSYQVEQNGEKINLELKTYTSDDGELHLQFLPLAQKINQAIGEERLSSKEANCQETFIKAEPNSNLVFSAISTSNYGTIYVIGDKRMPSMVTVVFRGTYSGKSAASYTSPLSISPAFVGFTDETAEKYLFGIFKLLTDIIHILVDNIIYVGKQINPNAKPEDISIFTTGHSLGGGLSTIFSYLWVAHLTSQQSFKKAPYDILNPNICCISIGSPRVMDQQLADLFCCLTSNLSNDLKSNICNNLTKNIKGRILFYRVTSYYDPVPGLPKHSTFTHPCSNTKTTGLNMRQKITSDCYVQITNSVSSRCRGKKLALTVDYNLPLNCVDTKEKRKRSKKYSPHIGMFMGYHTMYLGIIFISGIDLGTFTASVFLTREIHRTKNKDTVCRLIMYPNPITQEINNAGVVYYNLEKLRSKSIFDAIDDSEMEGDNNSKTKTEKVVHTSNYAKLKLLMSSTNKPIPISEDIGVTYKTFEILYKKCVEFDILTENPSIDFKENLQEVHSKVVDDIFTHLPIEDKKDKKDKKKSGGKLTQKTKKNYKKYNKTRKNKHKTQKI